MATLSDRAREPVFIWFESVPTAKSAIKVSSLSPDLWDIIVLYPIILANLITSSVSETVPIWLSLIKIEIRFRYIYLLCFSRMVYNLL